MPLSPGTRLGPYEVVDKLGEGGMGEVYRARDTQLNRDVAIKVLPEAFAQDGDRLARFTREAQALAALNHPNIAQVFGLEQATGVHAIVMELVEGEDLSAPIERGPMSLSDALPIARQITAALEAAHEAGIVHRDLKPANIKVRADGTIKVLDFGLAKATEPVDASGATAANSPTLTARATQMGMIIGTAAYMAPEQARGRAVDRRADIWAFGVVLYEMLTGTRAFAGDDITMTLAAVVKDDLNLDAVPHEVRRLLRACLQKDPKRRLRDISDAWQLLDDAPVESSAAIAAKAPASRVPWVVTAVMAIAALISTSLLVSRPGAIESARHVTRFTVPRPGSAPSGSSRSVFQVSPDGRQLAIAASSRLWIRSLDSLDAKELPRTEEARYPFWSPDGASIGFFTATRLKTISIADGLVQDLCAAPEGRGGAWNERGIIIFSVSSGRADLLRVPARGGEPEPITSIARNHPDDAVRYPWFLPDQTHFLYRYISADTATEGVYVQSLEGGTPVKLPIGDSDSQAIYAPADTGGPGYLLFARNGVLLAQAFDASARTIAGDAQPVADSVGMTGNTGYFGISTGGTGVLAYSGADMADAELVWRDRSGAQISDPVMVDSQTRFALAPGDRRLATDNNDRHDIQMRDLPGGDPTTLVPAAANRWSFPVWSPNGSELAYSTDDRAGLDSYEIHVKPVTSAGEDRMILQAKKGTYLFDWSRDGKFLLFGWRGPDVDLYMVPVAGGDPVLVAGGKGYQHMGQFSPDGRWIAYDSNETGTPEVYVRAFPEGGSVRQISTGGGSQPRWKQDGSELFYRAASGALVAVQVPRMIPAGAPFDRGASRTLFDGLLDSSPLETFGYQPSADGQRFLVSQPGNGPAPPINVALNWQATLKK